ncbi:iron chaperone [Microbacterium sp. NPDC056234]|uniref:iron chaperone n=1 Tax=Microbacterium sp. NPDC056234 TaxID=3345757 RepID=UPI0035D7052A
MFILSEERICRGPRIFAADAERSSACVRQFRPVLAALRAQLARTLPEAEEVKYDMPGFRIGRSIVASCAAFSKQCGLYVSPVAITAHAEDIEAVGLKATETGITLSAGEPIPDDLVERLARTSMNDPGLQPSGSRIDPATGIAGFNGRKVAETRGFEPLVPLRGLHLSRVVYQDLAVWRLPGAPAQ